MKRTLTALSVACALSVSSAAFAQEDHPEHVEHGDTHVVEEGHGPHEGFHQPDPINFTSVSPPDTIEHVHGEELHKKGPPPFIGPIINFALLLVLGYMALKRSINPSLEARRAAMETEIAEAKRLRDDAEAMHMEYAGKLERLDTEMKSLHDEFVKSGEAERDRIVAEAEAKAQRIREDAARTADQELRSLREELRREAVIAATAAAEETVRKVIGAPDQHRLADDYLTALEAHQKEARA